jgi:hypothetical protein
VRGQYIEGAIYGKPVVGYRQEQNVKVDSPTETFVALRLFIDNWRWADVPIYMRVGKRLPKSATEISVHFKKAPAVLFNRDLSDRNVLVMRRSLRGATRSRRPGLSSIRSRKHGTQRRMRLGCSFTLPARGDPRKPMICLPMMAGHGGDCETARSHGMRTKYSK